MTKDNDKRQKQRPMTNDKDQPNKYKQKKTEP